MAMAAVNGGGLNNVPVVQMNGGSTTGTGVPGGPPPPPLAPSPVPPPAVAGVGAQGLPQGLPQGLLQGLPQGIPGMAASPGDGPIMLPHPVPGPQGPQGPHAHLNGGCKTGVGVKRAVPPPVRTVSLKKPLAADGSPAAGMAPPPRRGSASDDHQPRCTPGSFALDLLKVRPLVRPFPTPPLGDAWPLHEEYVQ